MIVNLACGILRRKFINLVRHVIKKVIEDELREFLDSLVNKDAIEQRIDRGTYQNGSVLVRIPLPLENYRGVILKKIDYVVLKGVIDKLLEIKSQHGDSDHLSITNDYLGSLKNIPIEQGLLSSLPSIIRNEIDYSYFI